MDRRAPCRRGRRRQGPPGEGRQPGDGARRRRARRVGAGARTRRRPRSTPATRRLLDRLLDGAAAGGLLVGVGQPQPVRRRLGARRAPAPRPRPTSSGSRCSRGWRRRRRARRRDDAGARAAVHTGRRRRGLRRQHRLPVAPARRERRAGELPARAVHDHARLTCLGRRARAASRLPRSTGGRSVATPRRTQDRRTEERLFDPEAPFANEPDTDFTQPGQPRLGRRAPAARPAGRAPAARHDHRRDRRRSSIAPAPAPSGGGRPRRRSGAGRSPASPR